MKKIFVSFSGGRTSAFMAKWIQDNFSDTHEIIYVFANTGLEHEKTLEFVHKCDQAWGLGVVWLEAVTNDGRVGCTHKVVNFETAARNGEPFEDVICKYGISNRAFPHCNRELKLNPIRSYTRSIGWEKGVYHTAIGIRADEIDRMSIKAKAENLWYPLIKLGVTKQDVLTWWRGQEFDLGLSEHLGNCVTCWKKTDRKLYTIAHEDPAAFDFMKRMEAEHALTGAGEGERVFFRRSRSAEQIIAEAAERDFQLFREGQHEYQIPLFDLDQPNGCEESCDIFSDDFERELAA
ncbi:hypothetical protein [Allohahella sp. A8]|uniref:hypothetical protein n=1 Tax=Allohahella sp. A8 TaxID=3141461 RepID=UPI003A812067